MSGSDRKRLTVVVLISVMVGAGTLWLLEWAWHLAGEHDMDPTHGNLKNQVMRRKSEAMQEVMDAVVQIQWGRAEEAVARLDRYAAAINWYLDTDVYEEHGATFYEALTDLETAVSREDRVAAREATLRLEQSCFDCHYLIQQPEE